MKIAVLAWTNKDRNLISLEVSRVDDPPEEPPLSVMDKSHRDIMFRMTHREEPPEFPGFKLYGIGRFKVFADCGSEEAGTGHCQAMVMESAEVANAVNRLVYFGFELRCESEEIKTAAEKIRTACDRNEVDDLYAIKGEMIERAIGG